MVSPKIKHMILLGFVTLQMIVPLTYYLRSDIYDERFAWRMFSAVRLQRCQTSVTEQNATGNKVLRLSEELQMGWVGTLGRNRVSVIEAFLKHRCEDSSTNAVTLVNRCNSLSANEPPLTYKLDCSTGKYETP